MQALPKHYAWKRFKRHTRYYWNQLLDPELTYYASSLSFYTIFTVIPLLMTVLLYA